MESKPDIAPLVVILGATGSGKSDLALDLALRFNGEIIAADSRTVYQAMDIGTAKPTRAEQERVPHHLIDVVRPDEQFTVADFQHLAQKAMYSIGARNKVAFLVGGSGLYIDALIYNFTLKPTVTNLSRSRLDKLSIDELRQLVVNSGIDLPIDDRNPRRLIRALESGGGEAKRQRLRRNTLVIGLYIDREALRQRIRERIDSMVDMGLATEIDSLASKYGWDKPALQAPAYKAFRPYLTGHITLDEAKASFIRNDMNLAKRQYTWFKRNKDVHWLSDKKKAVDLVTTFLNK